VMEEMKLTVNRSNDVKKYNWQSFFNKRFQAAGGKEPFPSLFGAQPKATQKQREDGESTFSG